LPELEALPFDRAEVSEEDGTQLRLTPAQLLGYPLTQRVRWLIEGRVRFTRGNEKVDTQAALKALSALARPKPR
jgi:hypothetical protein